eukprot:2481119-Heterocapsa_arctica.AAC.1
MADTQQAAKSGLPSAAKAMPQEGLGVYKAARAAGKVVVVSKTGCTFCARAVRLLEGIVKPERLAVVALESVSDASA